MVRLLLSLLSLTLVQPALAQRRTIQEGLSASNGAVIIDTTTANRGVTVGSNTALTGADVFVTSGSVRIISTNTTPSDPIFGVESKAGAQLFQVRLDSGAVVPSGSSGTFAAGSTLLIERPFTTSGSTVVVGASPNCSGIDCMIASTEVVSASYIGFSGLSNSTATYRLRMTGRAVDGGSGGMQLAFTVANTSFTNAGYEFRAEERSSDGGDEDYFHVGTSTGCSIGFPNNGAEDNPSSHVLLDMVFTLNANAMQAYGSYTYIENGTDYVGTEWFTCAFNTELLPMTGWPNITDVQIRATANDVFSGKVRLYKMSD